MRYRADWVLPIASPPLPGGWVEIAEGRVVAVGAAASAGREAVDLGETAVLPGLVNAHTHLELSHLDGSIPPAARFVDWIRRVVAERRPADDTAATARVVAGIDAGIAAALATGTAVTGDISNSLLSVPALAASPLAAVVFHELIRFNAPSPEAVVADATARWPAGGAGGDVRLSLAAHAPYSVAPRLFRRIREAAGATPISVHLSESPAEVEFIQHGTGDWRRFLEDIGAWDPEWRVPGVSPVAYLDDLGFLGRETLAVHGVQMTGEDLATLKRRAATLVLCPRSNQRTGAGVPPVERIFASGVRVAVGTDSLASTPDLNVFAELAELRRLAPAVPAARLLESATLTGAAALGLGAEFGSIEAGKRARLLAVAIPPSVSDVEEYLVAGIAPGQIRWIDREA